MIGFTELYRAYARDVYRFALFLSGDPAVAEDIVSESFIRIWHARARVELTTVRAYLFTIARNLLRQQQRHDRHRESLHQHMIDPHPGPEAQARSRADLRAVLVALQALPEIDRAAVLMRADDAMSYYEIASALHISPAAAKVKVHRARLKLAEARLAGRAQPDDKERRS